MATIHGPKFTGTVLIDLPPLKDKLINLPARALQGARAEKEGINEVLLELATAIPAHGDEAEIHPVVYQRVLDQTADIEMLRDREFELEQALQACRETRAQKENNREDDISAIATMVEEKASRGRNPGLRVHFDKTIEYKSRFAEKSAATRKKNEEAKEAAKNAPPTPPVA